MDDILKNPGLDHIGTKIFAFFDFKTLSDCRLVSKFWNNFILNEDQFWVLRILSDLKRNLKIKQVLELFPNWTKIFEHFENKRNLPKVLEFVKHVQDFVDKNEDWLMSPTHFASLEGKVEFLTLLAKESIVMNEKTVLQMTPLHFACKEGHYEAVKIILESKDKNVNARNMFDTTPLHLACDDDRSEIVKALLENDEIDVNSKNCAGHTPLHVAVFEGFQTVTKLLVDFKRTDVNALDNDNLTPLNIAYDLNEYEIVQIIEARSRNE